MITIYFDKKPLWLTTSLTPDLRQLQQDQNTIIKEDIDSQTIGDMIKRMQQPGTNAGILIHTSLPELFNEVSRHFTIIKAAGGFVYTPEQQLLFIFRRKKWDLPKGKLDEGEDLPTCAIREVEEETGITSLQLQQPLLITYHTYYEKEQHILKESHWYAMLSSHPEAFQPQTEEDIEICKWVPIDEIDSVLSNTHPSIIDVVKAGVQFLEEKKYLI